MPSKHDYILTQDGELYHWSWKKKDAKYISREWKNGRWEYTYPDDSKGDNGSSNEQKQTETQAKINKAKAALGKFVDNISDKTSDYIEKRKQDWEEAKRKGTEKAARDATKYDGGVSYGADGAKKIKAEFSDTNEWFSSKRTIVGGDTKITEFQRGKFDRYIDTAKEYIKDRLGSNGRKQDWEEATERGTAKAEKRAREQGYELFKDSDYLIDYTQKVDGVWDAKARGKISKFVDTGIEYIKDRLGYDERDALNAADAVYKYSQRAEKNYQNARTAAQNNMGKINPYDGSITYTDDEKARIARDARTQQALSDATKNAGKKASEAADAYFNTPIGRLEKARNVGMDWLEKLFGRKR